MLFIDNNTALNITCDDDKTLKKSGRLWGKVQPRWLHPELLIKRGVSEVVGLRVFASGRSGQRHSNFLAVHENLQQILA